MEREASPIQWEAVEAVLRAVKECPEVKAAFLKGSLAKGIADEYSDVDFYCLVDSADVERFLGKRMAILETYRPLIYHSESNFVGPQLVAVFDNGLHFDLYTVTLESFPQAGQFRVPYDPDRILGRFKADAADHSLPYERVIGFFITSVSPCWSLTQLGIASTGCGLQGWQATWRGIWESS